MARTDPRSTYLEVLEGLLLLAEKEPDGARGGAVTELGRHLEEVSLAIVQ